ADVIMLDCMTIDQIKEAVAFVDGRAVIEVAGKISKSDLIPLADTGVDIISIGALTHQATCVDMTMQINLMLDA
ncbi:MAG: nicotinate-nucleotide diphosphorylase (carboxylating), partial [Deltaproteobacteria bacterium]